MVEPLYYIDHTLYLINQTKRKFRDVCQRDAIIKIGKNGYFNFQNYKVL